MITIPKFTPVDQLPSSIWHHLIQSNRIPVVDSSTIRWMDNRVCCRHARRDDPQAAAACPYLNPHQMCGLDGHRYPCVFIEPESAAIWQRIREQQQIEREIKEAAKCEK